MSEFQVEVKRASWAGPSKPHTLAVTHNGFQWTSIAFASIDEMRLVRDAIDEYIKNENS